MEQTKGKVMRLMNEDEVVTKKDFEKLADQLIKLIQTAVSSFNAKTNASGEAFRRTLAETQAKVDSLFVGEKMAGMEKKNEEKMGGMEKMHQKMMTELKDEMKDMLETELRKMHSDIKAKAVPGKPGPKGEPGMISLELAQKALAPLKNEIQGEWDKKVQALIDSRKMAGGTPHNLTQYFNATSQANGTTRTFTGLPTARYYPMIFLKGQNPVTLLEGVDFTVGRNSITILNHIEPPQTGVGCYIQYIK